MVVRIWEDVQAHALYDCDRILPAMSCVNFVPPGGVSSTQPQIASAVVSALIEQMAGANGTGQHAMGSYPPGEYQDYRYSVVQQGQKTRCSDRIWQNKQCYLRLWQSVMT
jgi:hypothetical protein